MTYEIMTLFRIGLSDVRVYVVVLAAEVVLL